MAREIIGTVIEKAYHPPPGAPNKYWCYLIVETQSGERVNVRLHQRLHNKITIGDEIRFSKPWRGNKRVRAIRIIRRTESSL
ncbi:MAG: hypothetical protein ACYTBX_08595 [Planctomycetota bacterium]|jgi:hypothetical protein